MAVASIAFVLLLVGFAVLSLGTLPGHLAILSWSSLAVAATRRLPEVEVVSRRQSISHGVSFTRHPPPLQQHNAPRGTEASLSQAVLPLRPWWRLFFTLNALMGVITSLFIRRRKGPVSGCLHSNVAVFTLTGEASGSPSRRSSLVDRWDDVTFTEEPPKARRPSQWGADASRLASRIRPTQPARSRGDAGPGASGSLPPARRNAGGGGRRGPGGKGRVNLADVTAKLNRSVGPTNWDDEGPIAERGLDLDEEDTTERDYQMSLVAATQGDDDASTGEQRAKPFGGNDIKWAPATGELATGPSSVDVATGRRRDPYGNLISAREWERRNGGLRIAEADERPFDDDPKPVPLPPANVVRVRYEYSDARSFHGIGVRPELAAALEACGYARPSPVQVAAFPIVSGGGHVVIAAETGAGKTLAYLVPILDRILAGEAEGWPYRVRALIIQYNRDLCIQLAIIIRRICSKLPNPRLIQVECLTEYNVSDTDIAPDPKAHILIGTPQRVHQSLPEKIEEEFMDFVALDEADRLMSMFRGVMERILKPLKDRSDFEPRIRGGTAPETQYLLAAATMPGWEGDAEDNVRMVIQSKWPDATWIKSRDLHPPLEGLHHRFVKVDHDSRDDVFLKAVEEAVNYPNHRLLVFGVHRQIVHRAHEILKQTGYEAAIFHSQVPFTIRCKTLADFATGKIRIIVCSPMASRGIDFPDVTHVISYEFGENAPELLHRLGRTARRGTEGWATTFYQADEEPLIQGIRQLMLEGRSLEKAFCRNHKFHLKKNLPIEELMERFENGGPNATYRARLTTMLQPTAAAAFPWREQGLPPLEAAPTTATRQLPDYEILTTEEEPDIVPIGTGFSGTGRQTSDNSARTPASVPGGRSWGPPQSTTSRIATTSRTPNRWNDPNRG